MGLMSTKAYYTFPRFPEFKLLSEFINFVETGILALCKSSITPKWLLFEELKIITNLIR